jgi:hypothetical protein
MAGTTSKTTAAYVFEKRNRSPVPVMMISLILFFTETRFQSTQVLSGCGQVAGRLQHRADSILALESLYRSAVCGIPSIRDHEP